MIILKMLRCSVVGAILYFHIFNRSKPWTLNGRFFCENILIGAANLRPDRGIAAPFEFGARFAEGAFNNSLCPMACPMLPYGLPLPLIWTELGNVRLLWFLAIYFPQWSLGWCWCHVWWCWWWLWWWSWWWWWRWVTEVQVKRLPVIWKKVEQSAAAS